MIIKYQLENRVIPTGTGLTTPECISDGGYFPDRDKTIIGYSDGTHPLGATCVEITEAELEARKLRIANTYECAIRSNGRYSYTEVLPHTTDGSLAAREYPSKNIVFYYKGNGGDGDSSCRLYSERPEGLKKYWNTNILAER